MSLYVLGVDRRPAFTSSDFTLTMSLKDPQIPLSAKEPADHCFIEQIVIDPYGVQFQNNPEMFGFPKSEVHYGSVTLQFVVGKTPVEEAVPQYISPFHAVYASQFQNGYMKFGYPADMQINLDSEFYDNVKASSYLALFDCRFSCPILTGALESSGSEFLKYKQTIAFDFMSNNHQVTAIRSVAEAVNKKNTIVMETFRAAMLAAQAALTHAR